MTGVSASKLFPVTEIYLLIFFQSIFFVVKMVLGLWLRGAGLTYLAMHLPDVLDQGLVRDIHMCTGMQGPA